MVRQDWFLKAIAARPDFFLFGEQPQQQFPTFLHSESGSISTDMCPTACGRAYTPNKVSNLSLRETPAHAKGTIVQPPAAMVRQDWFLKAIAARPDFFLFGDWRTMAAGGWTIVPLA
jgi:hypothetical protein